VHRIFELSERMLRLNVRVPRGAMFKTGSFYGGGYSQAQLVEAANYLNTNYVVSPSSRCGAVEEE
jgi:hypothetical protein